MYFEAELSGAHCIWDKEKRWNWSTVKITFGFGIKKYIHLGLKMDGITIPDKIHVSLHGITTSCFVILVIRQCTDHEK